MKPLIAIALVTAFLTPGCLLGNTCSTAVSSAATSFQGQTLTILDQGAFPDFGTLKPLFENLTGATVVSVSGGDAGKALNTALLSAGGACPKPPADVLYGVDNALFFTHRVKDTRLYDPYESPRVANIDRRLIDVDQFRIDGALWTTPVDHGYINVNYDKALGSSDVPRTLRDLATTKWGPRFVTEDPLQSSPGLGFLLSTIRTFGETGSYTWKAYWKDLFNNGVLLAPDWTSAYVQHYSGGYGKYDTANNTLDRAIVTSYTTSPAVEVYFGEPSPPGVSLEPANGEFHQIETMGILRGSTHVALARAWIDFCLGNEFQDRAASDLAVYPVVPNATIPDAFKQYATDPNDLQPATFTADQLQHNLDRWLQEWQDLYHESQA